MTTREDLRTMIRLRLGDLGETPVLTDEQINQWINDSIREYSMHFPRLSELQIECSASVREYSINGEIDESGKIINSAKAILCVEYPMNQEPPKSLLRRHEWDRRGFLGKHVYDVRSDPAMTLVLGLLPNGTETIGVLLTCDHPVLTLDTDVTTVPDRHLELILIYSRLLALQELAATEAIQPSPTGVVLSGLASMLTRTQNDYQTRLKQYILSNSQGGQRIGWGNDRVY
ncbi:MAG: hypothetical protein JW908_12445 [Anaerolineales bacterium]|nr:hypothetical protein [Anaerolineales bacterium]